MTKTPVAATHSACTWETSPATKQRHRHLQNFCNELVREEVDVQMDVCTPVFAAKPCRTQEKPKNADCFGKLSQRSTPSPRNSRHSMGWVNATHRRKQKKNFESLSHLSSWRSVPLRAASKMSPKIFGGVTSSKASCSSALLKKHLLTLFEGKRNKRLEEPHLLFLVGAAPLSSFSCDSFIATFVPTARFPRFSGCRC